MGEWWSLTKIAVAVVKLLFCNLAKDIAWGREMGRSACPSRRNSDVRPDMKQLSKNEGGKSVMRLARSSNS